MKEKLIEQHGERYRRLITDVLSFLDRDEKGWNLDTPICREEFIQEVIDHAKRGET
jgi:hypothetical protein